MLKNQLNTMKSVMKKILLFDCNHNDYKLCNK